MKWWPAFQLYYTEAFVKAMIKHLLPEFWLQALLSVYLICYRVWGFQPRVLDPKLLVARVIEWNVLLIFTCSDTEKTPARFLMDTCHKKHQRYLLIMCVWIWRATRVVFCMAAKQMDSANEPWWVELRCYVLRWCHNTDVILGLWRHAIICERSVFGPPKMFHSNISITLVRFYDDGFR